MMTGNVVKCRNDDGKCREMSGNVGISSGGGPYWESTATGIDWLVNWLVIVIVFNVSVIECVNVCVIDYCQCNCDCVCQCIVNSVIESMFVLSSIVLSSLCLCY